MRKLTIPWAPTLLCFFCCCPPRAADVSEALLVPPTSNAPFSCDKSSFRTRYEVGSSGTEAGTCARALASSADAVGDLTSLEPCTFFVATDERDFCDARKASHSSLLIDGAIGFALRMASARSSSDAWICRSLPFGLKSVLTMFGRQSLSRYATSSGSMPISTNSCAAPAFAISISWSKNIKKSSASA